jgi:hypothetical protein
MNDEIAPIREKYRVMRIISLRLALCVVIIAGALFLIVPPTTLASIFVGYCMTLFLYLFTVFFSEFIVKKLGTLSDRELLRVPRWLNGAVIGGMTGLYSIAFIIAMFQHRDW